MEGAREKDEVVNKKKDCKARCFLHPSILFYLNLSFFFENESRILKEFVNSSFSFFNLVLVIYIYIYIYSIKIN